MAGFAKFDPRAFLESERRAAANRDLAQTPRVVPCPTNSPETLAALATLAAPLSQNETRDVGQSSATDNHQHHGENRKSELAPAKVAKVAKVPPVVAADHPLWGDTNEERAAIAEYDGGAPRAWAEALARLDPARPPGDVPASRWVQFIDDCGRFLDDGWASSAEALGWRPLDLLGCDRERQFAGVEPAGLLWCLEGGRLVAITADTAVIETSTGHRQTCQRRPVEVGCVVLAWEVAQ